MSRTVLLVEDTEDNRVLATFLLAAAGHRVLEAPTGAAALDLAAAGPVDLVLMDLSLPGMDGYETLDRLRAQGFTGPVVAVTAHAMAGDRERVLAAGFAGYVAKPLDVRGFAGEIAGYFTA